MEGLRCPIQMNQMMKRSNPRQMTKMANHRWSGPQDLTWDLPDIFCLWLQRDSWHFLAYRASATLAPLPLEPDQIPLVWVMQWYGYDLLILIGAIAAGVIGIRLLGAAGKGTPTVIPPEDRELLTELIKGEKKAAINLYVVLSSLSGFTGTFQKIGFSGLPLATVTLTLIFSGLSFFQAEFLELAKLTLGAFIGSFVQKGRDAPKLPDA